LNNKNFITTPCLEIKQPLANFYVVRLKASELCKLTFSVPAEYSDQTITGTQRELKKARTKLIAQYVNGETATLPNSIILSANFRSNGDFVEAKEDRWEVVNNKLIIPTDQPLASIIDGQHRIDGFKQSFESEENPQDMDLLCSVFLDLPAPQQAEIFATINYNQQKVDKSLAYQLFGYSLDLEESSYWAPDSLAIYLTRILNEDKESPFYGSIKMGTLEKKPNSQSIHTNLQDLEVRYSTAALVEGIVKLISSNPIEDRYKIHKVGFFNKGRKSLTLFTNSPTPLRELYIDGRDRDIYNTLLNFFLAVDKHLWATAKSNSRIITTVGLLALFDILKVTLIIHGNDHQKFEEAISQLDKIDFSLEYFKTSGAARPQIRNMFKYLYYKKLQNLDNLENDSLLKEYQKIKEDNGNEFDRIVKQSINLV